MSSSVQKLESLLALVQRNRRKPRQDSLEFSPSASEPALQLSSEPAPMVDSPDFTIPPDSSLSELAPGGTEPFLRLPDLAPDVKFPSEVPEIAPEHSRVQASSIPTPALTPALTPASTPAPTSAPDPGSIPITADDLAGVMVEQTDEVAIPMTGVPAQPPSSPIVRVVSQPSVLTFGQLLDRTLSLRSR